MRVGTAPGAVRGTQARPTVIRPDIQALRAVAVVMVVLYHLWPHRLTGGYAGVDVFFVISGYLITAHLLLRPPRSVTDLLRFWGRRIRRLLPASLLVLAATLVASRLVAPATMWESTATHVRAAALYFVNWKLAADSVDYLAREEAATPVEHFWSLSVEEQFYLVWPLAIALLVVAAVALRREVLRIVVGGLALVVLASGTYSVYLTDTDRAAAYFVTPTRMWELGIGGLLAALLVKGALGHDERRDAIALPAGARIALCWAGFGMIAATAFTYTDTTPFPGWRALLPVLGSVAVIAAYAPAGPASPLPLMALRPVQWLGDVSYSVYLWHWPLIVLVPYVSGGHLGRLDKIAVIVAALILAGLTKVWVEDRFRTASWGTPLWKPYLLGATLMALVVGAATAQLAEISRNRAQEQAEAAAAAAADRDCYGAASIASGFDACPQPDAPTMSPSPDLAKTDKSAAYYDGCWSYRPYTDRPICHYGDGPVRVALIGNSHAGHWLPALTEIAKTRGWTITTYLASACAPTFTRQQLETDALVKACADYGTWALDEIQHGAYDLVITSNRLSVPALGKSFDTSEAPYREGFRRYLEGLAHESTPVVVIHDTPFPGRTIKNIPDCLAQYPTDVDRCAGTPESWNWYYPFYAAAAGVPGVHRIDLTRYFCVADSCPAVIGRVPVYFDNSHITATYSRTLAPYLAAALDADGLP